MISKINTAAVGISRETFKYDTDLITAKEPYHKNVYTVKTHYTAISHNTV